MLDTKSIYEALGTLDSEQALADAAHREALVGALGSGAGKGFLKTLRGYVKSNDARNKKRQRLLAQLEKAEKKAKTQKASAKKKAAKKKAAKKPSAKKAGTKKQGAAKKKTSAEKKGAAKQKGSAKKNAAK